MGKESNTRFSYSGIFHEVSILTIFEVFRKFAVIFATLCLSPVFNDTGDETVAKTSDCLHLKNEHKVKNH